MSADEAPRPKEDVVFVHGASEDGEGLRVVRKRDDAIELGEMRAMKEGRPIHGEVVKLVQRKEHERLFDVEVVMPSATKALPAADDGRTGPAQVASAAYRANWDTIFGSGGEVN